MMGHRAKLKGGDEWDALTKWRRYESFQDGELKKIKRKYSKRQRRIGKEEIESLLEGE